MSAENPTRSAPDDATRTNPPAEIPPTQPAARDAAATRSDPPADSTPTRAVTAFAAVTEPPPDPNAPTVPGYKPLELLGGGGMGTVWKAHHSRLNRIVALKVMLGGGVLCKQDLRRFLVEAEAVAAVRHPHVVQVYDSGEYAGRPYLAMEHLPGGTLGSRLKGAGRLSPGDAVRLVARIARGVAAAHAAGIVHRDLKPGNVLFDGDGEPKVADFGLAKRGGGVDLTHTGAVMGTPAYMAPEQAAGKTKFAGPQADVWALGVILYECLTGQRPFDKPTVESLLLSVMMDDPRPPRSLTPGVPRDLDLICLKCLSKDPAERYPTAGELADDLDRFAAGEPVSVRAAGAAERVAKWARRNPTRAAAWGMGSAAAVLLAFAVVVGVLWRDAMAAQRRADAERANAEAARDDEGIARGHAVAAQGEAERARDALAEQKEKLAVVEYGQAIQLAHQATRENNFAAAQALLAGTRADLRGWEYDHVFRLCHSELVELKGHTGSVVSAAFSPNGRRVATGSEDGTARVWDAETGAAVAELRGHAGPVLSAVFSPDGRRVVTVSGDKTVRVWEAVTGKPTASTEFRGHAGPVLSAAFSRDGRRVVTGSWDRSARVWDAATGAAVAVLSGHTDWVRSAAFSPDGRRVVTVSDDNTARVWDTATGAAVAELKKYGRSFVSAAFSPDGRQVVTWLHDGPVLVYQADPHSLPWLEPAPPPRPAR